MWCTASESEVCGTRPDSPLLGCHSGLARSLTYSLRAGSARGEGCVARQGLAPGGGPLCPADAHVPGPWAVTGVARPAPSFGHSSITYGSKDLKATWVPSKDEWIKKCHMYIDSGLGHRKE